MKIRWVFFDLDGTLLYTLEGLRDSLNHAMRRVGCRERTLEETRLMVGNGVRLLVARGLPGGRENPDYERAYAAFSEDYALHKNDRTRPYEGILPLLDELKRRGIGTGVVTNKNDSDAGPMIRAFFGGRIDVTVGKREGVPVKPDPASLTAAMAALGAEKAGSLYVGDSDVDYHTAENAGLPCALVCWGYRKEEELRRLSPAALLHRPEELLRILG